MISGKELQKMARDAVIARVKCEMHKAAKDEDLEVCLTLLMAYQSHVEEWLQRASDIKWEWDTHESNDDPYTSLRISW